MTKRRTYSKTIAGAALLAACAAPWIIACGSDAAATDTTPTPVPTTTSTTPTPGPASCTDGTKNGAETDVDCGGTCGKCASGQGCAAPGDCTTGVCTGTKCAAATCTDATKNGTETDVDCGGTCTTKCATGKACAVAADCATALCGSSHICLAISCGDGIKNGTETDIDCGGTCSACADTKACAVAADCTSANCDGTTKKCVAPTCTDVIKNGTETDVDCGGTCSTKCADTKSCAVNADCSSAHCDSATKKCVAPACSDLIKNGTESDIDCGGSCSTCGTGKACGAAADCTSSVCTGSVCIAAACNDTVKNGTETDIDCGGSCATKCADTKGCAAAADCTSGVCDGAAHTCTAPACNDGVMNGTETDVDCGGSCGACGDTKKCAVDADCTSVVCDAAKKTCTSTAVACADGAKDGTETDVDCGSSCATKCALTKMCKVSADCAATTICDGAMSLCRNATSCNEIHTAFPAAADGIYTINPDGLGAYDVYCDMTNDGGGWTLTLKADGNNATFNYDAAAWTDSSTSGTPDFDTTEAKLQSFNNLAFTNIRASMIVGGTTRSVVIPTASASLSTLFTAGYTATVLGRDAWKGLVGPTASLQTNCNQEGFDSAPNGGGVWPRTRIGIVSNQENNCGSPDSRIGIGGSGATCGGNAAISVGDVAGCSPDNGDVNIVGFGYVFVR